MGAGLWGGDFYIVPSRENTRDLEACLGTLLRMYITGMEERGKEGRELRAAKEGFEICNANAM